MKKKVICFGEALVDFISREHGKDLLNATTFLKLPGGAPANVAVGIRRLGVPCGFVGKVGSDCFGEFLKGVLENEDIDCSNLIQDSEFLTGLAFVALSGEGERSFSFYRKPGADTQLKKTEINLEVIQEADFFAYGSISFITGPSSDTLESILDELKGSDKTLLCFDPNLRLDLWPDENTARTVILEKMNQADLVKLSLEELDFLTGSRELQEAQNLSRNGGFSLLLSLGENGSAFLDSNRILQAEAMQVEVVDTTGAGDAFFAGFVSYLARCEKGIQELDDEKIVKGLKFANKVGAKAISQFGAMSALPTLDQVLD